MSTAPPRRMPLLIVLAGSLIANAALAGKLYRWVDSEGNVHFTDKIPAEQTDRGHTQFNERGLPIERIGAAKTKEELAREAELERLRKEKELVRKRQEAEDRVLLRTFHSVDDIVLSRDGKLAAIDVMIRVAARNNKLLQDQLAQHEKTAADLERSAKSIPQKLETDIAGGRKSLGNGYATILRLEENKSVLRDTYNRDIRRFRELKNLSEARSSDQPDASRGVSDLANVYPCQDFGSCDQAWEQAESFVREFSTTGLQRATELLITSNPAEREHDLSLTVARLPNPEGTGARLFLDPQCQRSPKGEAYCSSDEVSQVIDRFRPYMAAPPDQP